MKHMFLKVMQIRILKRKVNLDQVFLDFLIEGKRFQILSTTNPYHLFLLKSLTIYQHSVLKNRTN